MRGFFALLLVTNLLFLGWQLWREPQSKEPISYAGMSLDKEGMTLLTELDEAMRPPQRKLVALDKKPTTPAATVEIIATENTHVVAQSETLPSTDSLLCYQSTPLDHLEEAQELQQTLATMGVRESKRVAVQTTKINYWVMLPADKDLTKVNGTVETLKQRRVKDFFVVRSGRYENAISLGVYSTRERAEQRYKEIGRLKLLLNKPVIEALELPAKQLIVTFQLGNDESPDGVASLLDKGKQPHLKKISCN